ncbi:phosphatase PAP2 family protein [Aeromicrobium wangtongii]|uniref:Phosphatase PAP2 family protein n=1 Tax=Aeromicrobium wangtongii TaxID=2969247 RepID=A0ABY5M6G8_9ACTN|nr:phosphatase PAP2 family protein [Aeromicrobium wangtongii]MCD9200162.1 phosphatase PAP2 family protein [Aeromicrobium wangtongii]UUP13417.1 phosphatase PAP2 family protein [Aeromicrobium wangtongii]
MSTLTGDRQSPTRATISSSRGSRTSGGLRRTGAAIARRLLGARGLQEIALLASLWIFYSLSRLVAADDLVAARGRAADVVHIERYVHLDIEAWLNNALTPVTQIAVPMSFWYATLHYVVTPAVLAFIYFRHRSEYTRVRNAIVIGSAIGLACYLAFPTAPPRLMPGTEYLDALAHTASFGWWGGDASAPAGLGHITNELAAMPSLHVGWTVWVAWAVWRHTNRAGKILASLYVAGTTFVVVATGNHWVLDAVAGAAVVVLGIVASGRIAASRRRQSAQTTP